MSRPEAHSSIDDCPGLAVAERRPERLERASIEYGLTAAPGAALALADRDAGLWVLADQLSPGETLALHYRLHARAGAGAVHARLRLCAPSRKGLEDREASLRSSLSLAVSCAFPGFILSAGRLAPLPRRFPLRPPAVQLCCAAPSPTASLGVLRPRLASPASPSAVVLLPEHPLSKARLNAALAMLAESGIDAEIVIRLRPLALDAPALRRIREARSGLECRLGDPRHNHAKLSRMSGQAELLDSWGCAPRAVRLDFELGLAQDHDPLLVALVCRLLFGGRGAHPSGATLDLSTTLMAEQPRVRLTPDPAAMRLLGFAGPRRFRPAPAVDGSVSVGRLAGGEVVAIGRRDLQRHVYMIGATGVGKSTLIASMIRQDIAAGRSVVLIDPHGDLFAELRAGLPRGMKGRTTIADVADFDCPFTLNLFEIEDGPSAAIQRNFVCNQLIGIIKKVLYQGVPEAFGPMFEAYFRNAALLLMDAEGANASLTDFDRVFGDARFRRELLERCKDEMVVRFWQDIATKAGGESALENITPYIVCKLTQFTGNPLIRPIICARHSSLNFDTVMSPGGLCLVNLAKGSVGDVDAALIGAIVTTRLFAAILARTAVRPEDRHPVRLYMDEFQTYATDALGQMLAESRKFGLELVLANQSLSQIDGRDGRDIAHAIVANVANILAFRVGPPDAKALADWFAPEISPLELTRLPDFHFAARLLVDGQPAPPTILGPVDRA